MGLLDQAKSRQGRFDDAVLLISKGRYKDARELMHKLCAEDPGSRRFRVQLHLAWGLEHLQDNRPVEARREFDRVIDVEPENADARAALARVDELQKKRGILSKLFGK